MRTGVGNAEGSERAHRHGCRGRYTDRVYGRNDGCNDLGDQCSLVIIVHARR